MKKSEISESEINPVFESLQYDIAKLCQGALTDQTPMFHQLLLKIRKVTLPLASRLTLLERIHWHLYPQCQMARQLAYCNELSPLLQQRRTLEMDLLQHALAIAYLRLLTDYPSATIAIQDLRMIGLAMYRAIHYLDELQAWSLQLHLPIPERLWHHLHLVFRYAVQYGLEEYTLSMLSGDLPKLSLENIYKAALLFAAANTSRLTGEEITLVSALVTNIAPYASLHRQPNSADLYGIALLSDEGPRYQTLIKDKPNREFYLTLDTTLLIDFLNKHLQSMQIQNTAQVKIDDLTLSRELLNGLIRTWSNKPTRRFPRLASSGKILLQLEQHNEASVCEWDKENVSHEGYGLKQSQVIVPMQVGQTIRVQDPDNHNEWQNAIVRWLRYEKNAGMRIGIQLLP